MFAAAWRHAIPTHASSRLAFIHSPQAYSRALRCCKPGTDDALQPKVFVNLGITQEAEGLLMSACDHYKCAGWGCWR